MLTKTKKLSLRSRRASVLILVVVLLVLLALMCTAYVVTTRVDSAVGLVGTDVKGASAYDAQVFNAANGTLTTLVQNKILDDVYTVPTSTPPTYFHQPIPNYTNYTSSGTAANTGWIVGATGANAMPFIASRAPVPYLAGSTPPMPATLAAAANNALPPAWPAISAYLAYPNALGTMDFESPIGAAAQQGTAYGVNGTPTMLLNVQPAFVPLNYPAGTFATNAAYRVFPGLKLANGNTYLAADASGCGIADAGLFPIKDASGNRLIDSYGVQYYGAIKIVDNNSAVNATTAFSRTGDFGTTIASTGTYASLATLPNFGFFRSNIGLYEMFSSETWADDQTSPPALGDMTFINNLRFGGTSRNLALTPVGRGDFTYLTTGDALEMGLARRMGNPGQSTATANFTAFSSGGQTELAYHGALSNPASSVTDVDNALPNAVYGYARNFVNYVTPAPDPYKPYLNFKFYAADLFNGAGVSGTTFPGWFQNHFNQENNFPSNYPNDASDTTAKNFRSVRGFLTTNSAESNYVPAHDMSGLATLNVTTPAVTPPALPASTELMPYFTYGGPAGIPRAALNTASFGEMWRAFWNVMVEDKAAGAAPAPLIPKADAINANLMFRNPIRNTAVTPTRADMTLLRSAIASANAETLRRPATDNSVSMHQINLSIGTATVFGTRKQVYLTEAFAHVETNQASAYLGVELLNPYSTPLTVTNWYFATLDRTSMTLTLLPTSISTALGTATIPAGTTVFQDGLAPTSVQNLPKYGTFKACAGLAGALGKELVIVRAATDGGVLPDVTYKLTRAVPLDSIDLSSFKNPLTGALTVAEGDYQRTNALTWQFVYPNLLAANGLSAIPLAEVDASATPQTPALGNAKTGDQINGTAVTPLYTIPVALAGWPSPNPISGGSGNKFPFGGFARNADVLQVPYFGGYQIYNRTGALLECNSVTQDCDFTDDTSKNTSQQVGRFCSLSSLTGTAVANDSYGWAERIFDYVSAIQNPNDDYFPAVPNANQNLSSNNYPAYTPAPLAVANGPINQVAQANQGYEDSVPIQGRININTAPWQVLNMLPLVVNPTSGLVDTTTAQNNANLAYAIVVYRAQNGPFKTIFDLNKVPGFMTAMGTITGTPSATLALAEGDITLASAAFPAFGATGTPLTDFRPSYYQITRLSNLITTRSDTFTCYLLIQGWKNVGTTLPQLVVEQRTAFVIDRNSVNNTANTVNALNVTTIPNQ